MYDFLKELVKNSLWIFTETNNFVIWLKKKKKKKKKEKVNRKREVRYVTRAPRSKEENYYSDEHRSVRLRVKFRIFHNSLPLWKHR